MSQYKNCESSTVTLISQSSDYVTGNRLYSVYVSQKNVPLYFPLHCESKKTNDIIRS